MKFRSNAHTHTHYCDGKSTPREMLAAARRLGFVSLGFSGHADQGFDGAYSMGDGRQNAYEKELRRLAEELLAAGENLRLWVGLEQDGMVPQAKKEENKEQFDYILGSTHYLEKDFQGQAVAVDGDFVALKAYVAQVLRGDWMAMAQAYFDAHVAMLLADRPAIIGHFDLVRKAAVVGGLFDAKAPAYRRIALPALERALASGGVLEVNTGGMARGDMQEPYPSMELLGAWREMGGKVTVTSDCHDAAWLGYGLDDMLPVLKNLGYRSVERMGIGDVLWETVEV